MNKQKGKIATEREMQIYFRIRNFVNSPNGNAKSLEDVHLSAALMKHNEKELIKYYEQEVLKRELTSSEIQKVRESLFLIGLDGDPDSVEKLIEAKLD